MYNRLKKIALHNTRKTPALRCLLLVVFCIFYAQLTASTEDSQSSLLDLWPVAYFEQQGDTNLFEMIWPLIVAGHDETEQYMALRPLFYYLNNEDAGRIEVDMLWPLARYRKEAGETSFKILPFFYHIERTHNEVRDTDTSIFPILFLGTDTKQGAYLMLFPVGGLLKGSVARDWMRIVLFPLWMDSRKGTEHSWNFLFPLFNYKRDPVKKFEGLRIFPFYAHLKKEDRYHLRWFLWPLVSYSKTDMDKQVLTRTLLVFPLYGRSRGDGTTMDAVFWPFFSHATNEKKNYVEWNIPWPFWKYAEGDNISQRRIWPLWGTRKTPGHQRDFFLWPFVWRMHTEDERLTLSSMAVFPFYWQSNLIRHTEKGDAQEVQRTFWPLWHYEKDPSSVSWAMLAPLWFSAEEADRSWGFLWSLFGHRRDMEGNSETHFLWRVIRNEETLESKRFSLFPLFDYARNKETKKVHFLKGLFGYERGKTYKKIRFLFIPITVQGSDDRPRPERRPKPGKSRRRRLPKGRLSG